MTDIADWFKNLPIFTKYWLTCTVVISLLGRFGLLPMYHMLLLWEPLFKQFQIWRPLTALFFYPLNAGTGFHFMLNCFFLYNYSLRLETDHYKTSPADYFWLLIFNWLCCVIIGLAIELPIIMDPMVLSVLYVWCQLNKDVIVSFWFGTRFKAMYLPWVLMAMNLILSSGSMYAIIGILVGHLYFFLKFKYPQELGGPSLIETPSFLKSYFPDITGGVYGFGVPPVNRRQEQQPQQAGWGGHNWGRGQVLGRN
uniref:Derlin n=1 Tax=Corethrella appendiculata TaxID=1370023 RepID=U5EZG9_9DIPT